MGQDIFNGNLWALMFDVFLRAYGWYFNVNYLPNFLKSNSALPATPARRHLQGRPVVGAFACIGGGYLTDWFIRRTGNKNGPPPVWRARPQVVQRLLPLCLAALFHSFSRHLHRHVLQ